MKIEWTYLPQPHIYLSRLVPQQLADFTWVLMAVPVNGEHKADIGSQPIPDNPGHVPYCGDDGWVWVRRDAPELTEGNSNPLIAEMERRCAEMILVSQAVLTCADVFEQACEPRAPKPEWFGTGEGQWDSWMIWSQSTMSWELWRDSQEHSGLRKFGIRDIQSCLPVSRTGYPAPVGWKVVGE